jgi:hypothetical protein
MVLFIEDTLMQSYSTADRIISMSAFLPSLTQNIPRRTHIGAVIESDYTTAYMVDATAAPLAAATTTKSHEKSTPRSPKPEGSHTLEWFDNLWGYRHYEHVDRYSDAV